VLSADPGEGFNALHTQEGDPSPNILIKRRRKAMFSVRQKREISDKVQGILRETNHPELPNGEIKFHLHVDGAESGSWADIKNNGDVPNPDVNPYNELQDHKEIPNNLNAAIAMVGSFIDGHEQQMAKAMAEDAFVGSAHHGLGRYIRNEWGLWKDFALAQWFKGIGIEHPEDMSGIILTSFHRGLTGKDRDLEGQIKYYRDFWTAQKKRQPI